MIHPDRIHPENRKSVRVDGAYVLYWMSASQRVADNPALAYALELACHLGKPLLVGFALDAGYPEAVGWQFRFMAEGFPELERNLGALGIGFCLRIGEPVSVIRTLSEKACVVVTDHGYLRHARLWRRLLSEAVGVKMVSVESDVVVPVARALGRRAYAAHVLRPHLMGQLEEFLTPVALSDPPPFSLDVPGERLTDPDALLRRAGITELAAPRSLSFVGGEDVAAARLSTFLDTSLGLYTEHRRFPHLSAISTLSPYLHFGMISPMALVRAVRNAPGISEENRTAFIEQVVVRRELAVNFVWHAEDYDRFSTLPEWVQVTLDLHRSDTRPHLYDSDTLLAARTHDVYWNAAMKEMLLTGFMHNHMRMYWGKKVLEWMESPEVAWEWLIATNNRLFLDGRDPNSYAGCGWIFGLHDRPWFEREIFGKVRYMAASGLERKCRIGEYVKRMEALGGENRTLWPEEPGGGA